MAKAIDLMEKTVALVVTFHDLGNRRKVPVSQVEVDADKDWIAVSKKLIESDELDAIAKLNGEIKAYLDRRALPSLFKRGIYLLPIALVKQVNNQLVKYGEQRAELVEKFLKVYRRHINEAKERLQGLFIPSDYLKEDAVRQSFSLTWQFTSFNTPASLQQISRELYEEEKKKANALWSDARENIQQLLRANMNEMVSHLVDKLTPGEDGKKKIFRDTAVNKMREFFETFDARNVTDDSQLRTLVEKAKKLIEGVEPQNLRDDEGTRDYVKTGFAKIKEALATMVVTKPRRAIAFDEEAA